MHPALVKLVIGAGYPISASQGQAGVRSPRSGPGTLATRCSEWVGNATFWTPERRKARSKTDATIALAAREWRAMQGRDMERAEEERNILMEGHNEQDDDAHAGAFFLRQAQQASRYRNTLIKGVDDELDE